MAILHLIVAGVLLTTTFAANPACVCPAVFDPVCCQTSKGLETLSNSCQCRCAGGTVSSEGSCPPRPSPCICTLEFAPVCCQRGEKFVTEGNRCLCRCGGGVVVGDEKCVSEPACSCITLFDPVCCKVNGMLMTKSNSCFCRCAGGTTVSKGECEPTPSPTSSPSATPSPSTTPSPASPCKKCSRHPEPVCCFTKRGPGLMITRNSCFCRCKGGLPKDLSFCRRPKCFCTKIYKPVCCRLPFGKVIKAGNECECGCRFGKVVNHGCRLSKE